MQVKNKNMIGSTLIGECRLPVSMFTHGRIIDQWFGLRDGDTAAGEINLRVQYRGPGTDEERAQRQGEREEAEKERRDERTAEVAVAAASAAVAAEAAASRAPSYAYGQPQQGTPSVCSLPVRLRA